MTKQHCTHAEGFELEIRDEPTYTPGSVDNPQSYENEYLLCAKSSITSRHGVHLSRTKDGILVHGELDITRLSLEGETVCRFQAPTSLPALPATSLSTINGCARRTPRS